MLELYRKRMSYMTGTTPSETIRIAHDNITNDSFVYDANYRKCKIGTEYVDAKFMQGTTTDVDDDKPYYILQFRPHETYKVGTIIDIPDSQVIQEDYDWWITREEDPINRGCYVDEDGLHYRRWMIVDVSRDIQDTKYYIEECDWCLRWISTDEFGVKKLRKQLGVMRIRNSYSSGIYEKYYLTQVESQDAIWLPTTALTKTLYYDQRFLISDNEIHPQAYKLTGIYTNHPVGMTKLILTQVVLETDDDYENMIANGLSGYEVEVEESENIEPVLVLTVENTSEYFDNKIYMDSDSEFVARLFNGDEEQNLALDIRNNVYTIQWDYSFVNEELNGSYKNKLNAEVVDNVFYKVHCSNYGGIFNKKINVKCTITRVLTGEIIIAECSNISIKR